MRRVTLFLILIVLASGGCFRGIGPQSIPPDRTAYIEALGDSWREQLLFNIVKLRYHDALTFLDVSGITQAYTLNAAVNASNVIGWGAETRTRATGGATTSDSTVLGIVPSNGLTAGFSGYYQSTPTITYTPIAGEVIKSTIFSPLKPSDLFHALIAGWQVDFIIPYCFLSINNVQGILQNPSEISGMIKLVKLWKELDEANAISFKFEPLKPEDNEAGNDEGAKGKPDNKGEKTNGPKPKPTQQDKLADNLVEFTNNLVKKQKEEASKKEETAYIILDKEKYPKATVEAFQELLGLDKTLNKYEVVQGIPPTKRNLDKIYVTSRSVFQVLTLLAYFIDVPPSQNDWVWEGENPLKLTGIPHFHVMTTPGLLRPNEFAAIKYKGNWFYIPNGDTDTKRVFSGLMAIFSMMQTSPSVNPILTIPVR